MRLVCMSDTHGWHKKLAIPDGDVLVHAGDFSMKAKSYDVTEFLDWFKSLPHKHKIMTPGNHDMACENHKYNHFDYAPVVYLDHDSVEIEGVKFFASPYSVAIYDPSPWAFDYQRKDDRFKRKWMDIPLDTDVLITHGPPKGILDRVNHPHRGEDPNVGDVNLLFRVMDVKPKAHIFGHIHEGYGSYQHPVYRTQFYNVSVCTEAYNPTNPVTVIEL